MTKHEGDIVRADNRSRITLGRHFVEPFDQMVARTQADGSILLTRLTEPITDGAPDDRLG